MKNSGKLDLVRTRLFGDNFELTFDFFKQNFSAITKGVLPFFLIAAVAAFIMPTAQDLTTNLQYADTSDVLSIYASIFSPRLIVGYLVLALSMLFILLYVISYMKLYNESADGVVETGEVYNAIKSTFLPYIGGQILFGLIIYIGLILCVIPGVFVGIACMFYFFAYVNEENVSLTQGFKRSYELVKNNWWITLGFLIVIGTLANVVSFVICLPLELVKYALPNVAAPFVTAVTYGVSAFVSIFTYIGMGVQYYNLYARTESTDVYSEIDNIGQDNTNY